MVLWQIFVHNYETNDIEVIEIDNNETFSTLRTKVSNAMNVPFNDLLITGREEYNGSFNSKKLSEIPGISDGCGLYAVYSVGGGWSYSNNNLSIII